MRRKILSLAILSLLPLTVGAQEIPPAPTQWVTDQAGVIDAATESELNTKLRAFEQRSGAQFIIYTLPSLEGHPIEDWTIRAVEKWRVGQKKYDNGLVLFLFPEDRLARIEVGYGLEGTITDALSSRILREVGQRYFANGNYGAGLSAAADRLIAQIESTEEAVPVAARERGRSGGASWVDAVFPFIFFLILFLIVSRLSRRGGMGGLGGCLPILFLPHGGGRTFGGGGFGGGGFGGFSGGGGGFGGGGATGSW